MEKMVSALEQAEKYKNLCTMDFIRAGCEVFSQRFERAGGNMALVRKQDHMPVYGSARLDAASADLREAERRVKAARIASCGW